MIAKSIQLYLMKTFTNILVSGALKNEYLPPKYFSSILSSKIIIKVFCGHTFLILQDYKKVILLMFTNFNLHCLQTCHVNMLVLLSSFRCEKCPKS